MLNRTIKFILAFLILGFFFQFQHLFFCPDNSQNYDCLHCWPYEYQHGDSCCKDDWYTHEVQCKSKKECQEESQDKCYEEANYPTFHIIAIVFFVMAGIMYFYLMIGVIRMGYIRLKARKRMLELEREMRDERVQEPLIRVNRDSVVVVVPVVGVGVRGDEILDGDYNEECSICLVGFVRRVDELKKRRCGHVFHRDCIQRWVERNPTCPLCRGVE